MSSEWIAALITMVGTVFAGFGLKFVDAWLTKSSAKTNADVALREEYRSSITDKRQDIEELKKDIAKAKKDIDGLEAELDEWKTKYFEELGEKTELLARLRAIERRYKSDE